MAAVSMSGSDTIQINNRILTDLADQNVVELTMPNNIAEVKTGKNGNSIYALNTTGQNCEAKIRVIRGGSDDKYMNNLLIQQQSNFSSFVLLTGQFIKKVGDGQGNITSDTYNLTGGIFLKQVEAKSNVEGDTEQSLSVYTIKFANSPRAIG